MYRLSFLIVIFILAGKVSGQVKNIHGPDFKVDCKKCHSTNSWNVEASKIEFNHEITEFKLRDQHAVISCKKCHQTLKFSEAKPECVSCHKDIHSMTVGNDCVRCHTSKNWLVNNIPQLHEQNGFPLAGAHTVLSCIDCHKSETNQRWDRIGNDCVSCHLKNYNATVNPNHKAGGYSTNCTECHEPISMTWGGGNFHFFFALTGGHNIKDCNKCHIPNNYKAANPECVSCHLNNYNNTLNPKHASSGFGTNCIICHTTNPGWKPAQMTNHDPVFFPIYSGKHAGKWGACTSCHLNPNDYKQYSCLNCHEHSNPTELAKDHKEVANYTFQSTACYNCHPKGREK